MAHREITKDTVSAESEGAGYCREVMLLWCPVTARCSVGPFVIYLTSGTPVDQSSYHGSAHGQRAAVVTGWVGGGHLVAGHRSYGQRDCHTVSGTATGQGDGQRSAGRPPVRGTVSGQRDDHRSAGRSVVSGLMSADLARQSGRVTRYPAGVHTAIWPLQLARRKDDGGGPVKTMPWRSGNDRSLAPWFD